MNSILYNFINHKKINGTLFYCFEYYCFLRDNGIELNYIIVDISDKDLAYVKEIFKDKYTFNHEYLNDIIPIRKRTQLHKLKIKNLITLDTRSIEMNKPFVSNSNIFPYSASGDTSTIKLDFYGWYSFQKPWKYKTRVKLYKEMHKTFPRVDNKIFFSSYSARYINLQSQIGYKFEDVIEKDSDVAVDNLFSKISKVVYYGTMIDTNNRLVVEAYIHGIDFELYNPYEDSVKERNELIKSGRGDELFLTMDDLLIQDFIKSINENS